MSIERVEIVRTISPDDVDTLHTQQTTMTSSQAIYSQEREEKKRRFLALLEPVYDRLERFAFAMARDAEEGRDLIGETVLKAFEHFGEIRDEKAFLAYLFSIASRLHARRRQRSLLFDSFDSERAETVRSTAPQPDLATDIEILYAALARLPVRQRETVILHEIAGVPLKEIREIQGGTLSALKVRLWRARRELGRILGVDDRKEEQSNRPSSAEQKPGEQPSPFPGDLQRVMP